MAGYSKPRGVLTTLFAVFLFFHAAVAVQHAAHHHVHRSPQAMEAHLDETKKLLAERANNIAITGVTGTISPRLEIRDLKKNADQWNLYLLGLERFYAKDKGDRLSYYQIAGVHGRPYVTWNNFPTPLVNTAGFCPHGQTLFGSWHRPYLAIFEQAWYQCVQEVIATFPSGEQTRWKNAASTLRMPYWDWAKAPPSGEMSTPTLMRDKTVTVTKPSGTVSIANPLYSYSWGSSLPGDLGGGPWDNFPSTLRRPVSNPTRSNNNEVASRMASLRLSLRDRVYGLFMSGGSWGDLSTSSIGVRTSQNGNNPDSFESVHDAVHVTVGGETGGHMYYLDYSSFDPAFWLHHFNIDRLLAMYQVVSPNTYVSNGNINRPMAQWNAGEAKNSNTPLKPFTKNTNGDYFTSNDVKNTRVLGYYYPETAGSPTESSVKSAVNNLYGPGAPTNNKKRAASGQYEGRPFRDGDYNTVLSIIASKFIMDGSYSVHCWLGNGNSTSNSTAPYTNSTLNTESPDYVGAYSVMGGSKGDGGNGSYPVMTEGCLPLTTALQGKQAYGELKSLGPDDVEAYLKKNLHYKVIGPGGAEIPAENVPGLHVYVKTCPITPAKGPSELPSLGDYIVLPKVTYDKPAGKPYTYTPSPAETSPPYPTGTMVFPTHPADEPGYCVSHQKVEYVDPAGNYLYSE
ncbi:Di-copper centre-containing protein [Lindgomyces ingoldianus]|uniref:Di-copper centre-containing protein n=1 Tax=Lindgomyces ingoldianus TaxID=673940 RepID=A0ACB6QK91_9PLEO|nr:Di-copper centre-containing protein [Lindgomyces ingoldianus]KAF2466550.1 Di-copper centre-containing protein [Lindgomyces ingoldianus]